LLVASLSYQAHFPLSTLAMAEQAAHEMQCQQTEMHPRAACWLGLRRLWTSAVQRIITVEIAEIAAELSEEVRLVAYADRHEAMAEVILEGGDGEPVYFWKVRPGTRAEKTGMKSGDELLQVNHADPTYMFQKPAEFILPAIQGPVVLAWKSVPLPPASERARITTRRNLLINDLEFQEYVPKPWPVNKAIFTGPGEWTCGSCQACNFDCQEFCRRCGIRDSRLPERPRKPRFNCGHAESRATPTLYPYDELDRKDLEHASMSADRFPNLSSELRAKRH